MYLKKVCILGLGYIGLPTAAILSKNKFRVFGVDIDPSVVNLINDGKVHIVEPGLDVLISESVASGYLSASCTPTKADIYMICVPTPFYDRTGAVFPQPNVEYVLQAARSLLPIVEPGDLVILESTSPVGTTKVISALFQESGIDVSQISFAYCPERVLPGNILKELVDNDRIVGGIDLKSTNSACEFYRSFVKGVIHASDSQTAELCKLVENSYRDLNIAFANELALVCEKIGVNPLKLIELANYHPRVNVLQPGIGVGGHCIAVDPWFLVSLDQENTNLIQTARAINDRRPKWVIDKIISVAQNWEKSKNAPPVIVCLGIAFKPNVDDLRGSPAFSIAKELKNLGYEVLVVEPNITSLENLKLIKASDIDLNNSLVVGLVKHSLFIDLVKRKQFSGALFIDFCGLTS
jgi:UDP-N-acetyl-D-mannosaminuronic acid dehydrogenase